VLALAIDDRHVRVVTHYDVGPSQLEAACDRLESVMREQGKKKGTGPSGPMP
jgi:hypothetical protein